jgi:hypothetical protein
MVRKYIKTIPPTSQNVVRELYENIIVNRGAFLSPVKVFVYSNKDHNLNDLFCIGHRPTNPLTYFR